MYYVLSTQDGQNIKEIEIYPWNKKRIYITATANCGGKVLGCVKRLESRNIIPDKNSHNVDERKTSESNFMDMEALYENHNEELILNWSSICYVFKR